MCKLMASLLTLLFYCLLFPFLLQYHYYNRIAIMIAIFYHYYYLPLLLLPIQ